MKCSFCGKGKEEVKHLIAGGPNFNEGEEGHAVYVCEECLFLAGAVIEDDRVFVKRAIEMIDEGKDTIETDEGILILSFQYKIKERCNYCRKETETVDGDCKVCGFSKPTPLKPGEPCGHNGCLNHISHPCEGCGRIAGGLPVEGRKGW